MSSKRGSTSPSPTTLMYFAFCSCCCFYAGVLLGANSTARIPAEFEQLDCTSNELNPERKIMMGKIKKQAERINLLLEQLKLAGKEHRNVVEATDDTEPRFSNSMSSIMGGMAAVDRTSFAERFDVGVPLEESSKGNENVLLLFSHESSVPISDPYKAAEAKSNTKIPFIDDIEIATENCDTLNLILTQPGEARQCFAMMGQYRSFHLQKFMRLPEKGKLDRSLPLRLVNRGAQANGRKSQKVPTKEQTLSYWKSLTTYLQSWDATVEELNHIAEKAAKNNTLIVMVCNHGQSELLLNFACSCRARGFDISQVLVFATDEETKELAKGLGMHAFYDEKNYADLPKKAARRYADQTFTAMMMAKVYCVQMTVMLGYNVLFQDADIVWYKNPLDYFENDNSQIDVFFQDDGSRSLFYSPYSANTGMYFVRNNERTRYFFNSLLMAGDLISATHSHQIALIALLSEQASLYNLRVKVLSRDMDEFPGGFTYHRRHDYMRKLFSNEVSPYLFHMSWTESSKNKQRFFRQMGNWYLEDDCIGNTADRILEQNKNISDLVDKNIGGFLLQPCCSKKPLISCSFRDKPSIIPCKDSPNLDAGKRSFWD